jgi:hypothetical protein
MVCSTRQAAIPHVCEPLALRLRRFPRGYRRRLRKLVRGSTPLTDLLYAFPGAALTLAAQNPGSGSREQAIRLVKSGRPLKTVAAALGLPMWLRQLPPEAFHAPVGSLPCDVDFGRKIVNLIPKQVSGTPTWLRWIGFGADVCCNDFALWLARVLVFDGDGGPRVPLLPLAAYVWYSRETETPAHRLIAKPWHERMSFQTAVEETRYWLERIVIEYCLGREGVRSDWRRNSSCSGYRFVQLATAEALREEGDAMHHCVRSYWGDVAAGACLIFSVRRDGKRVATLEVIRASSSLRDVMIGEFRGMANSDPDRETIRAAQAWIARQGEYPMAAEVAVTQIPFHCSRWRRIWEPYGVAKPETGAKLLALNMQELARFFTDLKILERMAGSGG